MDLSTLMCRHIERFGTAKSTGASSVNLANLIVPSGRIGLEGRRRYTPLSVNQFLGGFGVSGAFQLDLTGSLIDLGEILLVEVNGGGLVILLHSV